jgi:hypothetical protein
MKKHVIARSAATKQSPVLIKEEIASLGLDMAAMIE